MNSLLIADFGADLHVTTTKSAFHQEAFFIIPQLKFIEGHFPENPILPAFATLEISLALGRKLDLLSVVFVGRYGKKPMQFFGTSGLIVFVAGLIALGVTKSTSRPSKSSK